MAACGQRVLAHMANLAMEREAAAASFKFDDQLVDGPFLEEEREGRTVAASRAGRRSYSGPGTLWIGGDGGGHHR